MSLVASLMFLDRFLLFLGVLVGSKNKRIQPEAVGAAAIPHAQAAPRPTLVLQTRTPPIIHQRVRANHTAMSAVMPHLRWQNDVATVEAHPLHCGENESEEERDHISIDRPTVRSKI